jgi:hypothetical protein
MSFAELDQLMQDNLLAKDYRSVQLLRQYYDIENIRSYWKGKELDYFGNLDFNQLEDALLKISGLPLYVEDYLEKYESLELRLAHFPDLISDYFRSSTDSVFVKQYLTFERKLRLVLVALRAKNLNRDLSKELKNEDQDEYFIRRLLLNKEPENFEELQTLFEMYHEDPLNLEKAISQYRFNWIQDHINKNPFSIDRVLGFMLQLILVEKWQKHFDNFKEAK